MSLTTYSHGVGSSCYGDQYHHEVVHIVDDNMGITLCGTYIDRKNWWLARSSLREFTVLEKRYGSPKWDETIICQKCAKKYIKGV